MKKLCLFFLLFAMIFSFSSCAPSDEDRINELLEGYKQYTADGSTIHYIITVEYWENLREPDEFGQIRKSKSTYEEKILPDAASVIINRQGKPQIECINANGKFYRWSAGHGQRTDWNGNTSQWGIGGQFTFPLSIIKRKAVLEETEDGYRLRATLSGDWMRLDLVNYVEFYGEPTAYGDLQLEMFFSPDGVPLEVKFEFADSYLIVEDRPFDVLHTVRIEFVTFDASQIEIIVPEEWENFSSDPPPLGF